MLLLLDILFGFDVEKNKRLELVGELFNLKDRITDEEIKIMNAVENLIAVSEARGIEKGKKEGKESEREENIRLLSSYLISQSGNTLIKEAANKKAEEILTKLEESQN